MASKILLIDDDTLVLHSLEKLFQMEGYNVIAVENGKAALEKIKDENFDLVVADIRMPEFNGIETVKKIREAQKNKALPELPVIFITGYTDSIAAEEASRIKTSNLLYKPFDKESFLQCVSSALRSK